MGKSSIQKVSNVSLLSETEIDIRYREVVGCAIGVFVCWGKVGKYTHQIHFLLPISCWENLLVLIEVINELHTDYGL